MILSTQPERRRANRRPADYEYYIVNNKRVLSGVMRDYSPYGVSVYSGEPMNARDELEISFQIPGMSIPIATKGIVVHSSPRPQAKGAPFLAGIEFTETLGEKLPLISPRGKVSRLTPSHTISIASGAQQAYRWLSVYERYPEWTSGVKQTKVLQKHPDGRGKRVEFLHDLYIYTVRYILDYTYDDQHNILSWVSAGGDEEIVSITGRYLFKDAGANRCFATYELDLTLSVFPSTRIGQYLTTILMRSEMKNFRNFVEKNQK